jgi:hypothetical protein
MENGELTQNKELNTVVLNEILEKAVRTNASSGLVNQINCSYFQFINNFKLKRKNVPTTNYPTVYIKNIEISTISPEEKQNVCKSENNNIQLETDQNQKNRTSQEKITIAESNKISRYKLFKQAFTSRLPCLIAWFLLLLQAVIYYPLIFPRLADIFQSYYWIILLLFKIYLLINVVVNFLIAMCRDPGFLPYNHVSVYDLKLPKLVYVNKEAVEIRWCAVRIEHSNM